MPLAYRSPVGSRSAEATLNSARAKDRLVCSFMLYNEICSHRATEVDLLGAMRFVHDVDTKSLRRAVAHLQRWIEPHVYHTTRFHTFLRIVNRIAFETPERVPRGAPLFGGFARPHTETWTDDLYPLGIVDGRLTLVGLGMPYLGENFSATEEFDHFAAAYPRRRTP